MDRYRLKNIIILILLLMNLFLLGSLAQRRAAEAASYRNTVEQMAVLFAADGIDLNTEAIPRTQPGPVLSLTRSAELEREAAVFLLGGDVSMADQGGGISTYSGENGAALFRSNGSFDAAGTLARDNAQRFCRDFCRSFGFSEPDFRLQPDGSGSAAATRIWDRQEVLNCTVTFTLTNGAVTAVSGTLLPDVSAELPDQEPPLSALAALTAFQQLRKETGAVVTAVSGISLCYEFQSTTALPMVLTPAWCIDTNTAKYYVNSTTGAVQLL